MYSVDSSEKKIIYKKKDLISTIMQNIYIILSTYKTEVPLDRSFAIDSNLIDSSFSQFKSKIFTDLTNALRKYEPRAILKNIQIDFEENKITLTNNDFLITLFFDIIEE